MWSNKASNDEMLILILNAVILNLELFVSLNLLAWDVFIGSL